MFFASSFFSVNIIFLISIHVVTCKSSLLFFIASGIALN